MNTTIYILPILTFDWTNKDQELIPYVSKERQAKIHRYHFSSDKRHSLYAELLTRMTISRLINQPHSNLTFLTDGNHKPYLKDFTDIHFNFSHTKGGILLGLSVEPIGVDIEGMDHPYFDIMNRFYHPVEQEYVNSSLNDKEKYKRFFEVWTRKEAILKFLGCGLNNKLNKINTISTTIDPLMTTWTYESLMCSVYSKIPVKVTPILVTEDEVYNFYINQSRFNVLV